MRSWRAQFFILSRYYQQESLPASTRNIVPVPNYMARFGSRKSALKLGMNEPDAPFGEIGVSLAGADGLVVAEHLSSVTRGNQLKSPFARGINSKTGGEGLPSINMSTKVTDIGKGDEEEEGGAAAAPQGAVAAAAAVPMTEETKENFSGYVSRRKLFEILVLLLPQQVSRAEALMILNMMQECTEALVGSHDSERRALGRVSIKRKLELANDAKPKGAVGAPAGGGTGGGGGGPRMFKKVNHRIFKFHTAVLCMGRRNLYLHSPPGHASCAGASS